MRRTSIRRAVVALVAGFAAGAVVFTVVSSSTPQTGTGYSKFLADVPVPAGVTIPELAHRNAAVVSIHAPRAEEPELLADRGILGIRQPAADVHEAATVRTLELATPRGMGRKPGARRDEPADDDVFLQSAQVILQSPHRSLGQHAGGLLEGGRGDERLGRK